MDKLQIVVILSGTVIAAIFTFGFFLFKKSSSRNNNFQGLMGASAAEIRGLDLANDEIGIKEIKEYSSAKVRVAKKKDDLSKKLFRAGYYSQEDKKRFHISQIVVLVVLGLFLPIFVYTATSNLKIAAMIFAIGSFSGFSLPVVRLDKKIEKRQEDTMYYLPLVIEQIAIGVSSSLDIGPCIMHILQMANERNSHNPVTEMFLNVEKLIKAGLNLEDALIEVGEANGQTEVKHAFMFLAQCSKHGGEISSQLQELADTIMIQRQTAVEARINALPVKATLPLTMVFFGFFMLLMAGFMVRFMTVFSGG